jgi:hypothetical protein
MTLIQEFKKDAEPGDPHVALKPRCVGASPRTFNNFLPLTNVAKVTF